MTHGWSASGPSTGLGGARKCWQPAVKIDFYSAEPEAERKRLRMVIRAMEASLKGFG